MRQVHIAIAWRLRSNWGALGLLRRVAEHVTIAEGFHTGHLSVTVVGARAMATLHRRYLNRAGPTDVLTFDLGTDRESGRVDGEIVVCGDLAHREARARGGVRKAVCNELALYVAHGILHLAGYDDRMPRQAARMHAREDELLAELGLGPVFRAGA